MKFYFILFFLIFCEIISLQGPSGSGPEVEGFYSAPEEMPKEDIFSSFRNWLWDLMNEKLPEVQEFENEMRLQELEALTASIQNKVKLTKETRPRLINAIRQENVQKVQEIIENSIKYLDMINTDSSGYNILSLAITGGNPAIVNAIFESLKKIGKKEIIEAIINNPDKFGEKPLILVKRLIKTSYPKGAYEEIEKILVANGAKI